MTIYRSFQTTRHPHEFRACVCGELRTPALKRQLKNGLPICRNCDSPRNRSMCWMCATFGPIELHHIAGRTRQATTPICINCHACVTLIQKRTHNNNNIFIGWWILFITFLPIDFQRSSNILSLIKELFSHE